MDEKNANKKFLQWVYKKDSWAFGVTLYKLLTCRELYPHSEDPGSENEKRLLSVIKDEQSWSVYLKARLLGFSKELSDLLEALLDYDPKKRITVSEALKYSWFAKQKE